MFFIIMYTCISRLYHSLSTFGKLNVNYDIISRSWTTSSCCLVFCARWREKARKRESPPLTTSASARGTSPPPPGTWAMVRACAHLSKSTKANLKEKAGKTATKSVKVT